MAVIVNCHQQDVPVDDRYAQVAQLVEQWTENPRVGGSNPPWAPFFIVPTIPIFNPLLILEQEGV